MAKKTNILVTGGAGFIGSNFIHYLLSKKEKINVVNYDTLTYAANFNNLVEVGNNPRYTFVKGDICNYDLLVKTIQSHKINYIINFAAETHVDHSVFGSAQEFVHSNVTGVMTLLNTVRDLGTIEKMIHISTDEVYGSLTFSDTQLFTEETKFDPSTPYAASKAGGDLLCSSAYNTWQLPVIVSHCSNNYGKYQHVEKLIPLCIKRVLEGKPILVHGDGLHIRDWIDVEDHCAAVYLLLKKGKPGEIYNIGANCEMRNIDVMKVILNFMDVPNYKLEYVDDRPANDRRYSIDSSKIRKLGWKPLTPREVFAPRLRYYINWYLGEYEK